MAFQERTDWVNSPKPPPKPGETPVRAADIKRWERGIASAHEELDGRLSEEGIDERIREVGDGTYAPLAPPLTKDPVTGMYVISSSSTLTKDAETGMYPIGV